MPRNKVDREGRVYRCKICGYTGRASDVAVHCFWYHKEPGEYYSIFLATGRRMGAYILFRELVERGLVEKVVE